MKRTLTSVLAFLALALSLTAQAETTNCTAITAVPYTITAPGIYCLTSDLSFNLASTAISISVTDGDIVLDLNGHTLKGAALYESFGIRRFGGGSGNLAIRNGKVSGFSKGIYVGASTLLIEEMILDGNTDDGIRTIASAGNSVIIRNNLISNTGGRAEAGTVRAIYAEGISMRIINNDIENVGLGRPAQSSPLMPLSANTSGISIFSTHATVVGNRINNILSPTNIEGFGIMYMMTASAMTSDNIISNAQHGISHLYGAAGRYMNNMTYAVTTPYTGGTAAGTTNY